MNNSNRLRKILWANVAFAELGAVAAFFLRGKWQAIDDLTNNQGLIFGIELLLFAGLLTYAAWKRDVARKVIWLIIALNTVLLMYLIGRLTGASISPLGLELIVVDALIVLVLIILQVSFVRSNVQPTKTTLSS